MVLYIAFLEDAHRSSSRSVACLNDARLEQGIEGSGREGYFYLSRHQLEIDRELSALYSNDPADASTG